MAAQTVWSSGVGASVGLEAGYTQLASGIASKIGQAFRLRRGDMRMLVGCGAAGAIAGAFGAPLGGAFYGFELIIGSYAVASLAPVGMAALLGYLTAQLFTPDRLGIDTGTLSTLALHDILIAGGLGLIAAGFGILLMRGVAACELLFAKARVRPVIRPMLGGVLVGLLALVSPQVMSSGHGALHLTGIFKLPIAAIATIFALKALASIVSLGSGFRGGLFFASLLLGALGGQMLSAVIRAMQVTREVFGYSFTTWRFHLRGETIRGAADVGWIRDLTVAQMMRADVRTTPVEADVAAFRQAFPLGSTNQVIAVDEDGRYAGMVLVAEAHAAELPSVTPLREILHHAAHVVLPQMTAQEAIAAFGKFEAEALAVVDSVERRQVLGLLSEAHTLRRFSDASERQRRELLGEM